MYRDTNAHTYARVLNMHSVVPPDVEYDLCLSHLWPLATKGRGAPLTFREGLQVCVCVCVCVCACVCVCVYARARVCLW